MSSATSDPFRISPPPALRPREGGGSALLMALPALGGVASVALVASMGMGASGAMRTRSLLAAGVVLLTTVGFVLVQLDRQRRQQQIQRGGSRGDYLDYLSEVRAQVREAAALQRAALLAEFPDPACLAFSSPVPGPGTFRRSTGLPVRLGLDRRPLQPGIIAPERAPGEPPDPVAATALERFIDVHRCQPDLPATVDLTEVRELSMGPAEARAFVCSAAGRHQQDRLRIAVLAQADRLDAWEWVKWLPHAGSVGEYDATGPLRLITTDPRALALAADDTAHLTLVVDGDHDVTALLHRVPSSTVLWVDPDAAPLTATPDRCSITTAEAIARRLASRHPHTETAEVTLPDLLAADTATRQRLRVPIGVTDSGAPLHLDLRESAEGGSGPHGLIVGATGSGKSELLRTLTVALAVTHPPEALNLVLVDFKGGATFAGLGALPHTSALITNLSDDLALVDRMHDALAGELVRRQEILRAAGNFSSLRELDAARAVGADLPVMPALLVIIDEFSELLAARPELADLFAAIGRVGRSLGVHLLLATQRLDEGRLRGLEAHLGYRIALRTFSAQESRAAIGLADAHELPRTPGVGYLSTGPGALVRFKVVHVSAPSVRRDVAQPRVVPFTAAAAPDEDRVAEADTGASSSTDAGSNGPSYLESAVASARQQAGEERQAHRIWLPPLRGTIPLRALLPDVTADPDLGLVSHAWRDAGPHTTPVGVIDRPLEQRHDPLVVRLDGATGHAAVVGAPRTGRSSLLRTMITGLALTRTPREAQFLLIDLAGGDLLALRDLPHVVAAADRHQPDRVRRIVTEAITRTDRTHQTGRSGPDGHPELFVVIDGWGGVRDLFADLESELVALAQRSLAAGVHLIVSANRWSELRPAFRDAVGTRLELRLGDPSESDHGRQIARLVPSEPGHGLTPTGHHFLAAHPGDPADTVSRIRAAWPHPGAPALTELPSLITIAQLHSDKPKGHGRGTSSDRRLTLGVAEDLAPVRTSPDELPHLLVYGDRGSGKSSLLRLLAHEVARTHTRDEARILAVDPRRSLLGEIRESHLLDHVASPESIATAVTDLSEVLRSRLPGPDVTRAQLHSRAWWSGPEIWLLVDDHDLIATHGPTAESPLRPLNDLLPHAQEIGLHLVMTRRARGASRVQHEPTIQSLRDNQAAVLLLDGPSDEGPLVGPHRARPQPPGRGLLVTRNADTAIQLAWVEPPA